MQTAAPAVFTADASNPDNRSAELAVKRYLESVGWHVWDVAGHHKGWDLELALDRKGPLAFRVDVKLDTWIDGTANVVLELWHQFTDGRVTPGWGRNHQLDWVAVVGADSYRALFVDVATLRDIGDTLYSPFKEYRRDNAGQGVGWTTHGRVIPLAAVWQSGALVDVGQLEGWR